MTAHAITLHLPETLYNRFQQRAKWTHRSVESEVLEAVASAAPAEDELPSELLEAVESRCYKLPLAAFTHRAFPGP